MLRNGEGKKLYIVTSMSLQLRKVRFEDEDFPHYFLCTYIPKGAGSDRLSKSLLSFKDGQSPHRKAWTDCATGELKKVDDLQGACILRALHHNEMQVRDHIRHSLDHLGVKIAHAVSGSYQADCLAKIKEVPKLTTLSKAERMTALSQAYKFSIPDRLPKRLLIIDDIYTSGATTLAILSAVLKAVPSCDISIFTLAATDYDPSLNDAIKLKSTYEWEPNDGWMLVAEDSPEYAEALTTLKHYILNDQFV